MDYAKRFVFAIFVLLVFQPLVLAHPNDEPQGVQPDSVLWGLDRAIEQISLLLTFNSEKKVAKGLEIAHERLIEVKVMIEENKTKRAELAIKEHKRALDFIKDRVAGVENGVNEEVELLSDIEDEISEQELEVEELRFRGAELTDEQKAAIKNLVDMFGVGKEDIETKIKFKHDQLKVRIKSERGGNITEEKLEEKISEKRFEKWIERLERHFEKAEDRIEDLEEDGENVSEERAQLTLASNLLEEAKVLFEDGGYKRLEPLLNRVQSLIQELKVKKTPERRGERAAERLGEVIEKLGERKVEDKNVSKAIEALKRAQEKIEERLGENESRKGTSAPRRPEPEESENESED